MRNMFTMMNAARIGVGMEGLASTERALQRAASYARERVQGRAIGSPSHEPVPIIEHPDVRRMLLTMKAYSEAMRALLYWTAQEGDYAAHGETEERRAEASDRLALITPIVKAWSTDVGFDMTSVGIQVHGGMGYVEETGAAQHLRDSRIAMIYEGTNGIQAIDLVLRKLPLENGQVVARFIEGMTPIMSEMTEHDDLGAFRDELTTAIQGLADTTTWMGERLVAGDLDSALAGATPYLRQFGTVVGGWLMAVAAVAAKGSPGGYDPDFLADKVNTARFYGEHLLPQANGLIPTIKAGPDLLTSARL
jgi:3-(methylthio)propanoyl-CoA dehydrogenase